MLAAALGQCGGRSGPAARATPQRRHRQPQGEGPVTPRRVPLQPYFDLRKLLRKDSSASPDASWVFCCAPYVAFAAPIAFAMLIPVLTAAPFSWASMADMVGSGFVIGIGGIHQPRCHGQRQPLRWTRSEPLPACVIPRGADAHPHLLRDRVHLGRDGPVRGERPPVHHFRADLTQPRFDSGRVFHGCPR